MIMSVSELQKDGKGGYAYAQDTRKGPVCGWRAGSVVTSTAIPSIHIVTPNYLQLPFQGAMPSSGLHAYQACTGCSYIHAGKILMHTKIKINLKVLWH